MAYPEHYHLDALRKLRGDAYVTFPTADLTAPRVERVFSVPREKANDPDAFNAPQTDEYTGTQLVEQHFTGGDAVYIEVFQAWEKLPGTSLVTKSLGAVNLMPEKYRRLIRTVETNKPVGPDYVFPTGLTGDQTFLQLAAETLAKLRLKIVEEVIDTDTDPLTGGKTNEWGPITIQESVVNDGDPVDEGFLVKDSTVTPLGNGKSIKITLLYPDDLASREQPGQEIDRQWDVAVPYIKRIAALGEEIGDAHKEITPIDYQRALVKTFDPVAIEAALGSFFLAFPSTAPTLNLPDVLESLVATWQNSHGDGGYEETGTATGSGPSLSLHLALNANAQASAAIMPDLQPNIKQVWSHNMPIMRYFFFLKNPISQTDVLTRLAEIVGGPVTAWPIFKPVAHTFTLKGRRLSLNVNANIQQHYSSSDSTDFGASASHTKGSGAGTSAEVGITVRTVRVPPTIHGALAITGGTSLTEPIDAEAACSMTGAGGGWDAMDSPPASESDVVDGSILPATLLATSPSSIPTSGKKLKTLDIDPYMWGWCKVHCEVFDFANLA